MDKVRKNNTSGYRGVSWDKGTRKWATYIRRNGKRHFLGFFNTPESASAAYRTADKQLSAEPPDRREVLVNAARKLYREHGLTALATDFLNKSGVSEGKLRRVGLSHADLLSELGLIDEYASWRNESFTYAGKEKPRWSWERAVEVARELIAQEGDLPTVYWCREHGYSQLTNTVHRTGREWEDLRVAAGLPLTVMKNGRPRYFESRAGIRWRSRPEACLSNFLYARGIEHKRGERYAGDNAEVSGLKYARYDLHFMARTGEQIDVEIWGDLPDEFTKGRYGVTRAKKEAYHKDRSNFLPLHYLECQSESQLIERLAPYIGVVEPFRFEKPRDRHIESAHWSDADDMLKTCRQIAEEQQDGFFQNEEWLRKRGRYADRPGESYNTLAIYIRTQLGGFRKVRELLGQAEASTTKWSAETVVAAWQKFEETHNMTPAQCKGMYRRHEADSEVIKEGARIYEVARRLGVVEQARQGRTGRKRKWTVEHVESEWRTFHIETGRMPTECLSPTRRRYLPRSITNRAARICQAATRLGMLERLREGA